MRSYLATIVLLVLIVACTSDPVDELAAPVADSATEVPAAADSTDDSEGEGDVETTSTSAAAEDASTTTTAEVPAAPSTALPVREGPRRETTGSVPHVQLEAMPVPAVDAELRRRAFLFPGVEERDSTVSTGARGIVIVDGGSIIRREILLGAGEFAHIHPDGSLHVWLPADRAVEVDETKWGELHPWVERDGFWDGVTMIFTPETLDELEVAMQLLVDSYNFVMGTELTVADVS